MIKTDLQLYVEVITAENDRTWRRRRVSPTGSNWLPLLTKLPNDSRRREPDVRVIEIEN